MSIRLKIDATSLSKSPSTTALYVILLRHPHPKFWVSLNFIDSPNISHLLFNIQSSFLNLIPLSFNENLIIELYLDDALLAPSLPSSLLHDGEQLVLKAASCDYGSFSQILSISQALNPTKPKSLETTASTHVGSGTANAIQTLFLCSSSASNSASLPPVVTTQRIKRTRRGGRRVQAAKKCAIVFAGSVREIAPHSVDAPVYGTHEPPDASVAPPTLNSAHSSSNGTLPRGHVYFDDEGLPLALENHEAFEASEASSGYAASFRVSDNKSRRNKRKGFVCLRPHELSVLHREGLSSNNNDEEEEDEDEDEEMDDNGDDDRDVSAQSLVVPTTEATYSSCPTLGPGVLPCVGDLLAFRELELDPDTFTPRVAAHHRVTSVLSVSVSVPGDLPASTATASARLRLRPEDAPDKTLELTLGTLLDVRLVRPATATAQAAATSSAVAPIENKS